MPYGVGLGSIVLDSASSATELFAGTAGGGVYVLLP